MPPATPKERALTTKEVALRLSVSTFTVRRYVKKGMLHRLPKFPQIRIGENEVDALISGQINPPSQQQEGA